MATVISDFILQPLAIEQSFDPEPWYAWMQREGMIIYTVSTIIYIISIFTIQKLMTHRTRFVLRLPLVLWNTALSIFSIMSAWRLNVATHKILSQPDTSYHSLVCDVQCYDPAQPGAFWLLLFVLSKLLEYGDTMFVVLRKAKLIVLHWYHHIITYMISAYLFAYRSPTLFVMAMVNTYVHSLMYPYYALRIMGVAVPKRVAMVITSIQIIQLFTGFMINFYATWALYNGVECNIDPLGVFLGLFGFGTVLALFVNFFIHAYILRTPKRVQLKSQ